MVDKHSFNDDNCVCVVDFGVDAFGQKYFPKIQNFYENLKIIYFHKKILQYFLKYKIFIRLV